MSVPRVTVLTAVRNGAPYISETIASIQAQTFSDWEYIIVDDNSNDSTVSIVDVARHDDPRIRLLHRKNSGGPYVAANDGLRAARGKYIVRIDADDLCPPRRIEKQLEFMEDHREYRACVSYWQAFNSSGLIPGTVTSIPRNSRVFRWALLLRGPSIHSTACLERSALEEIGGYRELPLSQDYRLWCDLTRRGWLGTIPEVLCYVRYHEKRLTVMNSKQQRDDGRDVLGDHLLALTGEVWSTEDLETLRSVGMSRALSVPIGLRMLDRWDRLWRSAPDLTDEDKEDLAHISSFRRWKHLRANARREPLHALLGLVKLAATDYRIVRGKADANGALRDSHLTAARIELP